MGYLGYPLPPYRRRSERKPVAPRVTAAEAMMAGEHADRPFGGWGGELLPGAPPAPATPAQADGGLRIEPPPWHGQEGDLDLSQLLAPEAPSTEISALEALKAASGDGYDPPPWRPFAPPLEPLQRFVPPEPDWKEEEGERAARDRAEKERAARERRAELLQELLVEDQERYPKGKS